MQSVTINVGQKNEKETDKQWSTKHYAKKIKIHNTARNYDKLRPSVIGWGLLVHVYGHDFHFRWCSCRLTITRRLSLVKRELLIIPEHPSILWQKVSTYHNYGQCCVISLYRFHSCSKIEPVNKILSPDNVIVTEPFCYSDTISYRNLYKILSGGTL
jgi:hypothetical protein